METDREGEGAHVRIKKAIAGRLCSKLFEMIYLSTIQADQRRESGID